MPYAEVNDLNIYYEEFGHEWKNINCPAFFINGEKDPFGTCEEMHEKVPSAKIYKVIDGSHHPHFVGEQIDEINKMILDFLSGI